MGIAVQKDECQRQFRFWLDEYKPSENWLIGQVMRLKAARKYEPTMKAALRLIVDLHAGKLDVLLELFPFVEEHFKRMYSQPAPAQAFTPLLDKNPQPPDDQFTREMRPVALNEVELEVKQSAEADTNGGKNLLAQLLAATQTDFTPDKKPAKRGKGKAAVKEDDTKPSKTFDPNGLEDTQPAEVDTEPYRVGSPKRMDVPTFDAPVIEVEFEL